jgi:hypothetical protein
MSGDGAGRPRDDDNDTGLLRMLSYRSWEPACRGLAPTPMDDYDYFKGLRARSALGKGDDEPESESHVLRAAAWLRRRSVLRSCLAKAAGLVAQVDVCRGRSAVSLCAASVRHKSNYSEAERLFAGALSENGRGWRVAKKKIAAIATMQRKCPAAVPNNALCQPRTTADCEATMVSRFDCFYRRSPKRGPPPIGVRHVTSHHASLRA